MSTVPAYTSLAAEQAAAEAEGIFQADKDERTLVQRWRALTERENKIAQEKAAIVADLQGRMALRSSSAQAIVVAGKKIAQWVTVRTTKVDSAAMRTARPDVVAAYELAKAAYDAVAADFITTNSNSHGRFVVRP